MIADWQKATEELPTKKQGEYTVILPDEEKLRQAGLTNEEIKTSTFETAPISTITAMFLILMKHDKSAKNILINPCMKILLMRLLAFQQ